MKAKKAVPTKAVEKKSVNKRRMAIKSQVKAGNNWEDIATS